MVSRSSFASKHNSTGHNFCGGVSFDAVVEGDDVEGIEELTLVFVDSLDMDVVEG